MAFESFLLDLSLLASYVALCLHPHVDKISFLCALVDHFDDGIDNICKHFPLRTVYEREFLPLVDALDLIKRSCCLFLV